MSKKTQKIDHLEQFRHKTDEMKALLEQEIQALLNYNHDKFVSYQDRKVALANDIEADAKRLLNMAEQDSSFSDVMKDRIRIMATDFIKVSEENQRTVMRMHESTRRIHERMIQAARRKLDSENESYESTGLKAIRKKKTTATAIRDSI